MGDRGNLAKEKKIGAPNDSTEVIKVMLLYDWLCIVLIDWWPR